ncbi:MAG: hypothetical protein LBU98_00025 [Alistipes sp.]|jgi:hypothetical protein|nr:hypothetical protein [Alistipes sp.]
MKRYVLSVVYTLFSIAAGARQTTVEVDQKIVTEQQSSVTEVAVGSVAVTERTTEVATAAENGQPTIHEAINHAANIATYTEKIADHTKPDIDYWLLGITILSLMIAFVSTWYAFRSWYWTKVAATKVAELRIKTDAQKETLWDIVRHLYRNKVVLCAIERKIGKEYGENGLAKCYPSEEHIHKLKVLAEDLHLDRFECTRPGHHNMLHEFELHLRNYNTKVDVTAEHLRSTGVPVGIKEEDLRFLGGESETLTEKILELMYVTEGKNDSENFGPQKKEYYKEICKRLIERYEKDYEDVEKTYPTELREVKGRKHDPYYDGELNITDLLNKAIVHKIFKDKIGLIPFGVKPGIGCEVMSALESDSDK